MGGRGAFWLRARSVGDLGSKGSGRGGFPAEVRVLFCESRGSRLPAGMEERKEDLRLRWGLNSGVGDV